MINRIAKNSTALLAISEVCNDLFYRCYSVYDYDCKHYSVCEHDSNNASWNEGDPDIWYLIPKLETTPEKIILSNFGVDDETWIENGVIHAYTWIR